MVDQQDFLPDMFSNTFITSELSPRLLVQETQRRCAWVKSCVSICLMWCLFSNSLSSLALAQIKRPPICHDPGDPPSDPPFRLMDINEVWERDQKWNKVPNPKNPPAYSNAIGIPADLIRNVLFIATEPSSGKVELTVKTSGGGGVTMLCGICDTSNSSTRSIPKFKLPEGSAASNEIEKNLNRDDSVGLRSVVQNVWNSNVATLAAPFIANSSLQSSTSSPLTIAQGTV